MSSMNEMDDMYIVVDFGSAEEVDQFISAIKAQKRREAEREDLKTLEQAVVELLHCITGTFEYREAEARLEELVAHELTEENEREQDSEY